MNWATKRGLSKPGSSKEGGPVTGVIWCDVEIPLHFAYCIENLIVRASCGRAWMRPATVRPGLCVRPAQNVGCCRCCFTPLVTVGINKTMTATRPRILHFDRADTRLEKAKRESWGFWRNKLTAGPTNSAFAQRVSINLKRDFLIRCVGANTCRHKSKTCTQ